MVLEKTNIYYPISLARKYVIKVKKNPEKYSNLTKAIVGARLPLTTHELLAASSFYSTISLVVGSFVGCYALYLTSPNFIFFFLAKFNLYWVIAFYGEYISKFYILLGFVLGLILFKFTRYAILSYPYFVSNRRRGEIDLYLPHAINMMYGMAVGGSPAYEMFKTIAESKHIFGELSKEFLIIMEMVEIFKKDLHEAIRFVRDTTPSTKLAAFLDDLVFILRGGGEVSSFLKRKSQEYLEEQEISFSSYIEFMGLMAEVYLSLFILLPLFIMIVLIVARLMGQDLLLEYRNGVMIMLPVASIFFTWIIKSSLPLPKIRLKEYEEKFEVIKANVEGTIKDSFSFNKLTLIKNKLLNFLLHPFRVEIYEIQLRIIAFHFSLVALLVFLISYKFVRFDLAAIASFSSFILPFIVLIEMRERLLKKAEKNIPNVFSELAMLNEAGLNVIESFKILSSTAAEMGALSKELSVAEREIELGILVPRAIVRMSLRLKSDIFAKVVPIIVKALETAPTVKDAFYMVSRYAETEILFRSRIKSSMTLYVIIIYMSIGIFLLVSYIVIKNFLSTFTQWGVTSIVGIGGGIPSLESIKMAFFQITLIVSSVSGIIAGIIGDGKVQSGLKHSYILTMATYIVYAYFI